jgi:hypothetical protein
MRERLFDRKTQLRLLALAERTVTRPAGVHWFHSETAGVLDVLLIEAIDDLLAKHGVAADAVPVNDCFDVMRVHSFLDVDCGCPADRQLYVEDWVLVSLAKDEERLGRVTAVREDSEDEGRYYYDVDLGDDEETYTRYELTWVQPTEDQIADFMLLTMEE